MTRSKGYLISKTGDNSETPPGSKGPLEGNGWEIPEHMYQNPEKFFGASSTVAVTRRERGAVMGTEKMMLVHILLGGQGKHFEETFGKYVGPG